MNNIIRALRETKSSVVEHIKKRIKECVADFLRRTSNKNQWANKGHIFIPLSDKRARVTPRVMTSENWREELPKYFEDMKRRVSK